MEADKIQQNNFPPKEQQQKRNCSAFNYQNCKQNFPSNPEFNDSSLNDIQSINGNSRQNSTKYIELSMDKDFSFELNNNFNNENTSLRKINSDNFGLNPKQIQDYIPKKMRTVETRKLLKENWDNIPLPIFDCIYCSNEKVAFNHFSKEILNEKYYYSTSIYDIQLLNKIISNFPLIDTFDSNIKMIDLIIRHSEYVKKYYNISEINEFYKSEIFLNKCKIKYFNLKISKKNTTTNKPKKKLLFRGGKIKKACSLTNTFNNNSAMMNFESSKKIIHSNISIQTNMNSSTNNSTIFFNVNNVFEFKDNNNIMLDNIVENIEKNSETDNDENENNDIMKIFKMDFVRKINRNNIEWDEDFYDIWNPKIIPIIDNDIKNKHHTHLKTNCSLGEKIKKKNTSYSNNNLNISGKNKNYLKTNYSRQIKRTRYTNYGNFSVDKKNVSYHNKYSLNYLKKDKNFVKKKLENSIFINIDKLNNNDNNPNKLRNTKKVKSTLFFKPKKYNNSKNKTPNKITKNAQIYKFKSSTNNQCIDINLNNRNKTRPKKKNVEINIFKNELDNNMNNTIINSKITKKQVTINLKIKCGLESNRNKLNKTLIQNVAKKTNSNFFRKKNINNINNSLIKKQNNKGSNNKNINIIKSAKRTKTIFKKYNTKNIFGNNNPSIPKRKNRKSSKSIKKKAGRSPKNNHNSEFNIKNLEIFLEN